MENDVTIPILPCPSINDTLDFYRALGFEVTFQQAKPNNYAVVCRGTIELHFFSMRNYLPANSYSTCYVRVADVDGLYQALTDGLKQKYGRVPSVGIPRVIPLKNKTGRREFIVVDPGGNWIRIGQTSNLPQADEDPISGPKASKLSKVLEAANLLSDAGDDAKAAQMLKAALARNEPAPNVHRVKALVYCAGLAITLGDDVLARSLLDEVDMTPLDDHEKATIATEISRASELAEVLQAHATAT